MLDALAELIPGFAQAYDKHFDARRSDESDIAAGVELECADAAIREALEKRQNRKNHP